MPCESMTRRGQSIRQRIKEVDKVAERVSALLSTGRVTVKIGPQGAVVFVGLSATERDDVTDACIYRRILATGGALARQKIRQAEILSGRSIDKKMIAQGAHSHDGGATWHNHKG